jgi:hypothetical protein
MQEQRAHKAGESQPDEVSRRRYRFSAFFASLLVASVAVLLTSPAVQTSGASSISATKFLSSCLQAAAAQQSVRATSFTVGSGVGARAKSKASVTLVTDASISSGVQHATFTQNGRTGHEIIELFKNVGYFEGDAFTLQYFNGLSATASKRDAGLWISVPKSYSSFESLTSSLTVTSLVSQLNVPSPALMMGKKADGVDVSTLVGSATEDGIKATFTLSCRATGSPLPVTETVDSTESNSTGSFERWGEMVNVNAPPHSISLTTAEAG